MKKVTLYIGLVAVGALLGIIAQRNKEHLIDAQYIRDHWHFRKVLPNKNEIAKSEKTMVFLAIGQSNAANYGLGDYQCKNEVYNYYKGELYRAKEPLLGPDGGNTSVWTRVADMLIDSGLYKKVIIVPCAIGSTPIECWTDGDCKKVLERTLDELNKDHIKLTHIFWDQGETDNVNGTTKLQYKEKLKKLIGFIRSKNFNAPFFSSITSYVPYGNEYPFGINPNITGAQHEVINETSNVFSGPNTDDLNLAYYRNDAVHFTEKGLDRLAKDWFDKIKAQSLTAPK